MLDKQVAASDLPRLATALRRLQHRGGEFIRHIHLQLLSVRIRWRSPLRCVGRGVEVVWEVLRLGEPHGPVSGETGFFGRLDAAY